MSDTAKAPDGYHHDDALHVVCDALFLMTEVVADGLLRPWEDYAASYDDNDDDFASDAKATEAGYVAILRLAYDDITAMLSAGKPLG